MYLLTFQLEIEYYEKKEKFIKFDFKFTVGKTIYLTLFGMNVNICTIKCL